MNEVLFFQPPQVEIFHTGAFRRGFFEPWIHQQIRQQGLADFAARAVIRNAFDFTSGRTYPGNKHLRRFNTDLLRLCRLYSGPEPV